MQGLLLSLAVFIAMICVLGSGSTVFVELETIAERPDAIGLHTMDGDLSIFSHSDFSMEMDVHAMSVAPLTFQSSYTLSCKTLVMSSKLTINGLATSSFTDADESAMIYAAAQATNITETSYHEIDTSEATFVQHTNGYYNVSNVMVYTYLPKHTFGDNGRELIEVYEYTKVYFEQNVLNGMFRILLAEGGLSFSTTNFDQVKGASVTDEGYEFKYPTGYFDKGELLSAGDKAAIVIMSIIGFGIAVLALYYLIVTFRANKEHIRASLTGEKVVAKSEKTASNDKGVLAFSPN